MESPEQPVHAEQVDRAREAWKRRPFARTFDLIAAEYGWTDDQILDLTMQRMSQIRSVIWERKAEDRRAELSVREYELKTLASYIAGSAGNEAGVKNVDEISLLPAEEKREKAIRPIPAGMVTRMFRP